MNLTGQLNQCQGCKEYFNSNAAFTKHRVGKFGVNRRCMTPEEMLAKGMVKNSRGFWVTMPRPDHLRRKANEKEE